MSQSVSASITNQMHMAYNAVVNTISHEEILSSLEIHGFSRSMIEQGETIYEAATLAVGAEIIAEEEFHEKERQSEELQKNIRQHYTLFTEKATECFGRDALEMLGLRTSKPRSSRSYCECLKVSLQKLESYPDLRNRLETKGFGPIQIQSAMQSIEIYHKVAEELQETKQNLENASKKRNTALFTQRSWLTSFAEAALSAVDGNSHLLKSLGLDKKELYTLAQIEKRRGKPVFA